MGRKIAMSSPEIWRAIKAFYDYNHESLLQSASEWGVSPYSWDLTGLEMSPIEALLWGDIRSVGAVLYPQYPVAGFFLDFGNPAAKVAIECDGAMFHLDKEKDRKRDEKLRSLGWSVYRFSGRQCHEDTKEVYDDDGCCHVELSGTFKRLSEIAQNHGLIVGSKRGKK